MNRIMLLTFALVLSACGKSAPTNTVESLVAHPDRLREVEQRCANVDAKMAPDECNAASEARHRLFMGNGPQYTPPKDPPKF
ncbi:entry exclusion lipoprotein TrbK [Pandoraea horticolens]|uniref:Entry exclusion lipoprotein TrbK n=2 Tax=Pandoraea horticolens TaxID=2508298 RepID=A0A5E4Z9N3_9BURK|nr:entry exclusion lipoprotein TrbK [Pandoraea horticolens]